MRSLRCAALLLSIVALHAEGAADSRPMTVSATIETTRIVHVGKGAWSRDATGEWRHDDQGFLSISPNGQRYVMLLVRGDLARGGNWGEIVSGGLTSLEAAQRYATVARLFTKSEGDNFGAVSARNLTFDAVSENRFTWLPGNERVAFKWVDEQGVVQVFTVNVTTHELLQLTHHPTHVGTWGMAPSGAIVYGAKQSDAEIRATLGLNTADGFALSPADPIGVFGLLAGLRTNHRYKNLQAQFVLDREGAAYRRIDSGAGENLFPFSVLEFSPDGRYALTLEPPAAISKAWSQYEHPSVGEWLKRQETGTAESLYGLNQVFLIDLLLAHSHALWDAPIREGRTRFAWAPDSQRILLTNTYLPIDSMGKLDPTQQRAGLSGASSVEFSIAIHEYEVLPLSEDGALTKAAAQPRWLSPDAAQIENDAGPDLFLQKRAGRWQVVPSTEDKASSSQTSAIRLDLRQDPNTPPRVFAIDNRTRRERLVMDPNPGLTRTFKLGAVEDVAWSDSTGRAWAGRLYRPTEFKKGRRYPLVIQDNGTFLNRDRKLVSQEFSLDGSLQGTGLGPGVSVLAAQPLANRGIAVLQLTSEPEISDVGTPQEGEIALRVYESAVAHLVQRGLVEPSKVGLAGFSRTGYRVLFALTHSTFPYAAAITSDNVDFGYWQRLFYVDNAEFERVNGGPPFGEGLQSWLRNAPGFNVEKIHTPLRLQNETGPLSTTLFMGWEIFSRMRTLQRPVELYVVPDIEHGTHPVQNPKQVLANKQGAVDWFDFWLNGFVDEAADKREQYRRWQLLRRLHERDIATHKAGGATSPSSDSESR